MSSSIKHIEFDFAKEKLWQIIDDNKLRFKPQEDDFIAAVDPGGVTGIAVACVSYDPKDFSDIHWLATSQYDFREFQTTEDLFSAEDEFVHRFFDFFETWPIVDDFYYGAVHFIIEDFILRQGGMGRELLSPVRIASKIQYAEKYGDQDSEYYPWTHLMYQSPSSIKTTCTPERMKAWGFPKLSHSQRHSFDALRHIAYHIRSLMAENNQGQPST